MNQDPIVFIDGARTPFLRSGGAYMDLMSYELGKFAIRGLIKKTGIDPELVDRVVMGTTISNVKTGNVAREASLTAGVSSKAVTHTVTMACISANQAITSGVQDILNGQAEIVIAGGTDSVSDAPILFNKPMRKKLFRAQKIKGLGDGLKFLMGLRPKDFFPEAPAVAEYTTNRTMGTDCDIMVGRFGVGRREQDEFALRSHQLAAKAAEEGLLAREIAEVELAPNFKKITEDDGIRGDSTIEKLGKLRPAFIKPHGTLTAANSSFLTDGATACLLMRESKAKELGLKPKSVIVDWAYTGQDLETELLLGPTYATHKLMEKTGSRVEEFDVYEFHEAFAGQILTNLKCLSSDDFAKEKLGTDKAVGKIPMDKFNRWGGSLSLGHPFGATGGRLLTTASNRLIAENGKRALIAACAAGAQGHAMIIERYQSR